jgi:hypothetical protein
MSAGYMRRCSGKGRHETKTGASAQRSALAASLGLPTSKFSVYRCDQCLGWHVGGAANAFITRTRRTGKRPNKRMRGRV